VEKCCLTFLTDGVGLGLHTNGETLCFCNFGSLLIRVGGYNRATLKHVILASDVF